MNFPRDPSHRDVTLKIPDNSESDIRAMIAACITGDLATVQKLLTVAPSLAGSHYDYRKPIHFAVREDHQEIVDLLLRHDPDPLGMAFDDSLIDMARDRGLKSMEQLLHLRIAEMYGIRPEGEQIAAVIRESNLSGLRTLLDSSPDWIHIADARGNKPIHWAVMTRQIDMIDELLSRGADLEMKRIDGARPIQLTNGDYWFRGWRDLPKDHAATPRDVLNHLRANGAICDICTASHIGDLDQVRKLLHEDPSLANRPSDYVSYYPCSGTPIRNAAGAGHIEIVRLLLSFGADPNLPEVGIAPEGHALYQAATNRHVDIVRLLLEYGALPNTEVDSSMDTLSRVIANGDTELRDLLCSWGAARSVQLLACDNDLQTAAAVFSAHREMANDPDALANAAAAGHELFVRLMLRFYPDLPQRVTFPAWSVCAATMELNELMFQHGMDANRKNWLGITPLHLLARKGDIENAALFLAHGADIHARDSDLCSTPLGWAAKFGQTAMVRFLLEHGAKPDLPDDPAWATPLAWAVRRSHTEIVALLRQSSRFEKMKPQDDSATEQ